jgi:RNA polymerase sigma-70 factor (ECF subfamily)
MSNSQSVSASCLRGYSEELGKVFWQQCEQYRDYLYRRCIKWMGNPTDAEDALSRAMLKAWEKFRDCTVGIKNFKAWLIQLTHNLCVDIHRERNRGARRVESLDAFGSEAEFVSQEENPVLAATRRELKKFVGCAIDELPTRLRETFILHFYEELSHQEIAQQQSISYDNVCKRISQARAFLREELRGYFLGEDGTQTELSVTPSLAATESAIGEKTKENAGVEPILGEAVTFAVAVEEVEIVVGEKPQEAVAVSQLVLVDAQSHGEEIGANFSPDVENLSSRRREALNSSPTLVGKRSFSEEAGGLGLGLVFPHGVKSQLNNPIGSS